MRFKAVYEAQDPQVDYRGRELLDRNGDPLRTYYLRGREQDITKIRKHLKDFCLTMRKQEQALGSWTALQQFWFPSEKKLPHIGNDPKQYTLQEIVQDLEAQVDGRRGPNLYKDITRSFIDRYNYIVIHIGKVTGVSDVWFDQKIIDIEEPVMYGEKFAKLFEFSR